MLFSSIVVILQFTLLQSNTFSILSTDDENVNDGIETEGKPTEKSILLLTTRYPKK